MLALACCAPVAVFVLYVLACLLAEVWRLWPSPWWDPFGVFSGPGKGCAMLTVIIVLLVLLALGGGAWVRYPAWGTAGPGYPDLLGVLLVVALVILLLRFL